MKFTNLKKAFQRTRQVLRRDWLELTNTATVKETGTGASEVLHADWLAEQQLAPILTRLWPDTPLLCEEAETSGVREFIPNTSILSCVDTNIDLPSDFISLDGVDGSAQYSNGLLGMVAILAGRIKNGKPVAALAMLLDEGKLYSTGISTVPGTFRNSAHETDWQLPVRPLKQCLIGTDGNRAVDPMFQTLVVNKLMQDKSFLYPLQFPSGAGALAVLNGNLAGYITSNARNWDLAATSALCLAAGMIVRCLDGSEVPWNRVRMPPVVFARDEEAFDHVQKVAKEYLERTK